MAGFSRAKGKRAESEVRVILQSVVNRVCRDLGIEAGDERRPLMQRNTLQSHAGGADIIGIDFMALEVKYCETFAIPAWWRQTLRQTKTGQVPVLMYRRSRVPWTIMLDEGDGVQTIDLPTFERWVAQRLLIRLSAPQTTDV
jgi:hypothetical protein